MIQRKTTPANTFIVIILSVLISTFWFLTAQAQTDVKNKNEVTSSRANAQESQFHTVVIGDTLSTISVKYYSAPHLYSEIFEANRPMLIHPDKIYPGQVLRIPFIR